MKYKLLVFVYSFLISGSSTTTIGNCVIDDDDQLHLGSTAIYEVSINDVEPFEVSFPYTGNLYVLYLPNTVEDTADIYTETVLEDDRLVLRTNDFFISNFEEAIKAQDPQSSIRIKRAVGLRCDQVEVGFVFTLNVADTNNHPPAFPQDTYYYKLPSPASPSIDLTSAGDGIIVTDLDFSNTDITFDVTGSSLFTIDKVKVTSSGTQRDYRAVLKVSQFQTLTGTTELTVTATDNGSPPQISDPVTIIIKVDTENSLPIVFPRSLNRCTHSNIPQKWA